MDQHCPFGVWGHGVTTYPQISGYSMAPYTKGTIHHKALKTLYDILIGNKAQGSWKQQVQSNILKRRSKARNISCHVFLFVELIKSPRVNLLFLVCFRRRLRRRCSANTFQLSGKTRKLISSNHTWMTYGCGKIGQGR